MAWDRDKERKAGKVMTLGGCIFVLVFALIWCGVVVSMGAWFMLIPGLFIVGITAYRLVLCIQWSKEQKAPQKEADPWDRPAPSAPQTQQHANGFCPYCGSPISEDFTYCPKCGRRME